MPTPKLLSLATELGDLTPEELAVVLPEASRHIRTAPHWQGGRSEIASLLQRAGHRARCVARQRRVEVA